MKKIILNYFFFLQYVAMRSVFIDYALFLLFNGSVPAMFDK